jgi:hypothetical protein
MGETYGSVTGTVSPEVRLPEKSKTPSAQVDS